MYPEKVLGLLRRPAVAFCKKLPDPPEALLVKQNPNKTKRR